MWHVGDSGPNLPVVTSPPRPNALAAIGIGETSERVYRFAVRHAGCTIDVLADGTGRRLDEVMADLEVLSARQLVTVHDGRVYPEPPERALDRLVEAESRRLAEAEESLALARTQVADYVADHRASQRADWRPAAVDVIPAAELADLMFSLVGSTTGELLFLRPDQWYLPSGARMDVAVIHAVRGGRRSRVIYPDTVLEANPDSVQARARSGERIRVLPEVPTRMAVFGTQAAILPEEWGSPSGHRLLIRQPALVAACVAYFDSLWGRAVSVAGFADEPEDTSARPLLEMLARGAKDEQIARSLDLSLRTVRRRVADLMASLGADSRFQAGVEAVRHGWL